MLLKRRNEHILVTGGAGAIGSNLVRKLLKMGHKIYMIDNLSSGHRMNIPAHRNMKYYNGSITNNTFLSRVFKNKIDRVFHLAAFFANQNSIEHPQQDLLTNCLGTINLLKRSGNVKSFLFASTSCFYAKTIKPLNETMNVDFETPYAISKFASEGYAGFYNAYYNVPVVIVRYFNSYGPGEYPGKYRNVIPKFFADAIRGKPLVITGTGQETRSFTYIDDIISGTIKAAYSGYFGDVFNIGNPQEIKIINLAKKINKITKNQAGIAFHGNRAWDSTARKKCSIRKACRMLGYHPKVSIDEGLKKTYKWFLNNSVLK